MRKFIYSILSSAFFLSSLQSASVKILNDSPYPLSVLILSNQGKVLGRQAVDVQQQILWQDSNLASKERSLLPFTVLFHCPDGSVYGSVDNVSTAGMVMASTAHGNRFCNPVKNDKDKTPQPPTIIEQNQKGGTQPDLQQQIQQEQAQQAAKEQKEQEERDKQLQEYFKEKTNPDVEFKPKPINPEQWSNQDRY